MLKAFGETNAGNIEGCISPSIFHSILIRDITGVSREGSHDPEWNAIIPESNQYLESCISYVGVRLDINGHTTDPKESNWRSLT